GNDDPACGMQLRDEFVDGPDRRNDHAIRNDLHAPPRMVEIRMAGRARNAIDLMKRQAGAFDEFAVRFKRCEVYCMTALREGSAQTDEGEDISSGSQRDEHNVHSSCPTVSVWRAALKAAKYPSVSWLGLAVLQRTENGVYTEETAADLSRWLI